MMVRIQCTQVRRLEHRVGHRRKPALAIAVMTLFTSHLRPWPQGRFPTVAFNSYCYPHLSLSFYDLGKRSPPRDIDRSAWGVGTMTSSCYHASLEVLLVRRVL